MTLLSIASSIALASPTARADAPANEATRRAEAQERFDRGLALLKKKGHETAALAEFQRAYELAPATRTLFMIGVVDGMLDRPVDALRALDQVLRDPGPLPPDQIAVARQRRDEQSRRVGYVRATANAPAVLQVDGIDTAHLPDPTPIPVAAGARVLTAIAAGHLPARKEITIAGGTTADVAFDLVPTEHEAAHLRITANVPDADVFIDDGRVGRTPLPGTVTVVPGPHVVEARRPGYDSARREIALQNGAQADVTLALAEGAPGAGARGRLALDITEREAEVTVDGAPRGVYRASLALPAGRHVVRVAHAGFLEAERTVDVSANGETSEIVALIPTPETRETYVTHARSAQRWARAVLVAGAVLAAGGGALAALEWGPVNDARTARDHLSDPGQACFGLSPGAGNLTCDNDTTNANSRVARVEAWRAAGLIGAGVGIAAAVVGTYLVVTGDDPERYDAPAYHARAGRAPIDVVVGDLGARRASLAIVGRF